MAMPFVHDTHYHSAPGTPYPGYDGRHFSHNEIYDGLNHARISVLEDPGYFGAAVPFGGPVRPRSPAFLVPPRMDQVGVPVNREEYEFQINELVRKYDCRNRLRPSPDFQRGHADDDGVYL